MAHPQPGVDPRKSITPESFHVAPHLLGLPLASPSRRLAAILLDLLFLSIVANLGGKILFALATAFAFFWFAGRRLGNQGGFFSKSVKAAFRGFGALMLFIGCVALWSAAKDRLNDDDDDGDTRPVSAASMSGQRNARPNGVPVTQIVRGGLALRAVENAKDSASAHAATVAAVTAGRRLGMTDTQIRGGLMEDSAERSREVNAGVRAALPPPETLPPPAAVKDSARADSTGTDSTGADSAGADSADADTAAAVAARPDTVPTDPDSLAAAYVAAVRGGEAGRAAVLRPKLASTFARDSLDELSGSVRELQGNVSRLETEKKVLEQRGLLATLIEWLDDLGIGFGWSALYFTFFTAMMKGQTPAKKLFGIRVLRLDGGPMTLWASFERYGGYAAGLFTGLTGYMQVWWDRNRQAVQDKISETVVIRDTGLPLPVARPGAAYPPQGTVPPYGTPPYGQGPYGQGPHGQPPHPPRPPAGIGTP